jgi:hypothetical protein
LKKRFQGCREERRYEGKGSGGFVGLIYAVAERFERGKERKGGYMKKNWRCGDWRLSRSQRTLGLR